MAASNPSAWWDGLVVDADGATITAALLSGATVELRVVRPSVEIAALETSMSRSSTYRGRSTMSRNRASTPAGAAAIRFSACRLSL